MEKTLKQLLQQPDILGEIDNFHGSRDDILQDMCDGGMFKKHPLFSTDEKAIQIIAYYDEVRSGTEEEFSELNQLLEDISVYMWDFASGQERQKCEAKQKGCSQKRRNAASSYDECSSICL